MKNDRILAAKGGFFLDTYLKSGVVGCARKILAAIKMQLPILLMGRRTNRSVGAYFDLITDDAMMFYGDNFHFGYFKNDNDGIEQALANHTDAVALLARAGEVKKVLDLGCGVCTPAIRIAKQHGCHITGVNISAEQVKQGKKLVAEHGLSDRITVTCGNALELDFEDASFDSILCIEVAGDICVTDAQKVKLVDEMHRVLKPGGRIGFSDLVFKTKTTRDEDRVLQSVLYHKGSELVTDWPEIFRQRGFALTHVEDIIGKTMRTWDHSLSVYETRLTEVERRYGRTIARRTMEQLKQIPAIIEKYGSFLLLSVEKPVTPAGL